MKKYISLLLISFSLACGTRDKKKDSSISKAASNPILTPNYQDSLLGRWLLVEKHLDKYVHPLKLGTPETYIKIDKKDNEYRLVANNIDKDKPGTDLYRIDSVQRIIADTVSKTYEYFVYIRNTTCDKGYDLVFSPIKQSMQDVIRISGFFDQNVEELFVNENEKDKYSLKNETMIQQVSEKVHKPKHTRKRNKSMK